MNQSPRGGSASGTSTPHAGFPTAVVTLDESVAHQVALTRNRQPGKMSVRAVRHAEVVLEGPVFLPRNTRLSMRVNDLDGSAGHAPLVLRGTVRKLQMTGSAPTYSLWVRLEEKGAPEQLHQLWLRSNCEEKERPSPPSRDAAALGTAPRWALRLGSTPASRRRSGCPRSCSRRPTTASP